MKSLLISASQQEKLQQDETERRRTLRLLQTRQLEKQRAAQLRHTVANEKKKQTYLLINQLKNEWLQQKVELHENLEYQFRENLMEMGKSHQAAADQPDYERQWLVKTLDNDARAIERGQQALDKLHVDTMQNENERNLHILHRKAALELEKVRSQRIAKLPLPDDPLRDLQLQPTTIVTVHDPYNFTTTRYHLDERLVTREENQQSDAAQDAIVEQERVDALVSDKNRLWSEQQEKARVRGDNALKREVLDNAYENVLDELNKLERQDRERRQKDVQNLPKSIFLPPWRREEEREERQRKMETAFEQVYQENHRKEPIPIVLMNEEEEEEDAASDRTLVPADEEKEEHSSPEYRMATVTPSANTIPVAEDIQEDDEATLADPTLMTLQTPLPEQQQPVKQQQQQQNMLRLLHKIERQREEAQNRNQQALVTPIIKTPKRLIVSPGYAESGTSLDSSQPQREEEDEERSLTLTTSGIEDRRVQLEARKQALEEQIRLLSERANCLPPDNASPNPIVSSSSDLSVESLLKKLRTTSGANSVPSSSSSLFASKQRDDDDHEQFAQAVQAIITSDESHSSSSGIAIEDDDNHSLGTISDEANRAKIFLDRYESHSSEDRDHSLEELISRLVATQQSNNNNNMSWRIFPSETSQMINPTAIIIDDLVDDAVSSISSLSIHTPNGDDQRSASPEIAQLLMLNTNQIEHRQNLPMTDEENRFYQEKRLIEQELELIRRERETLLNEHENYRQQTMTSSLKQQQPPPPPSLLRAKLNVVATSEAHELSTIQEVDTPVSSRNNSLFHHRSPLKSSFDLQQLERISSADSSSLSSEHNSVLAPVPIVVQTTSNTGLERDDSGISLIDGPRSTATSRTTFGGGNGGGGGKSSSSGIQSLLTTTTATRRPRVRTITNETTTTTTSNSANVPLVVTSPRSNTESDDRSTSSISKKWRDILANECLLQLPPPPTSLINTNKADSESMMTPQLTHSLGFGPSSNVELSNPETMATSPVAPVDGTPSSTNDLPSQEQLLRSQYDNEQCDLMSLLKVHEYLTKQQHLPSSTMTIVEQLAPSSSTPPAHHQSHSTLTSVTYRSSLAKQPIASSSGGGGGPPVSTLSHSSSSSSELVVSAAPIDGIDRRNSLISDIHHLTRSPNTFETSMNSSSSSSASRPQHDTLSYLIEQNQRAMQRLIAGTNDTAIGSTTIYSSASMRQADYESGALTTTTTSEKVLQKSTLIETGSLSTTDFPLALLQAEEQPLLNCKIDVEDERGILEEPSLTLLSNSYRSLTASTGQIQQQQSKKKQCSSPLSSCYDKTSACTTPSLSPIKKRSIDDG